MGDRIPHISAQQFARAVIADELSRITELVSDEDGADRILSALTQRGLYVAVVDGGVDWTGFWGRMKAKGAGNG